MQQKKYYSHWEQYIKGKIIIVSLRSDNVAIVSDIPDRWGV